MNEKIDEIFSRLEDGLKKLKMEVTEVKMEVTKVKKEVTKVKKVVNKFKSGFSKRRGGVKFSVLFKQDKYTKLTYFCLFLFCTEIVMRVFRNSV